MRSLHTMPSEVCYKQQFFIPLTRIEEAVKLHLEEYEKNIFFFLFGIYS